MPTDVLRVSGDYIVQSKNGTVTLDTPLTIISGNLTILGTTTNIESSNANIKDNILLLNSGEPISSDTGGISVNGGTSGIAISRGYGDTLSRVASLIYDDAFTLGQYKGVWNFGSTADHGSINDTYNLKIGQVIKVAGIVAPASINTLTLLGSYNPNAVLSVKGTNNYIDHVTDPDHIPNKAYVDSLIGATEIAQKLQVGNSAIEINDNSVNTSSKYHSETNRVVITLGTSTNAVLELQGSAARFKGLVLTDNRIQATNTASSVDINIEPYGHGVVQLGGALRILRTPPVASTSSYTTLYSTSTVGGGGTGLYYVNTQQTDELVSRRRSIVFSIIF